MKSLLSTIKAKLINLYLAPLQLNYDLGLSARNRIFKHTLHFNGLLVLLKKINSKKHKGLLLDVGCHAGGTTFFFAKQLKELQCIGFEPNRPVFEQAKKTYTITNLQYENIALSNKDGVIDFFITDNEVSSSLNNVNANTQFSVVAKEEVVTRKLDTYLLDNKLQDEKILALKIDVQGYELSVLHGAEQSLKKTLLVLVEMSNHSDYEGGAQYFEVDAYLRSKGFLLQNMFTSFSTGHLYEYDAVYINVEMEKKYF